jgi:hypothetical protein
MDRAAMQTPIANIMNNKEMLKKISQTAYWSYQSKHDGYPVYRVRRKSKITYILLKISTLLILGFVPYNAHICYTTAI